MELVVKSSTYLIHDFISGLNKPSYIGFKGPEFLEAGYIYAPYIPMMVETEPELFQPRTDITSRYAMKIVNNSYYGTITL
jgi:hypothetical protein